MLIWDYIRDFLVQNIFGGCDSNGDVFSCTLGNLATYNNGDFLCEEFSDTTVSIFNIGHTADGFDYYINLADWLSTTTTIIIMCVIVVLFALLVRWVFKTVVSAFLLK